MNELLREKEELAAERDQQLVQISELRADTAAYLAKLKAKETERLGAGQECTGEHSWGLHQRSRQTAAGFGGAATAWQTIESLREIKHISAHEQGPVVGPWRGG